ncbi:hypothetical protein HQ49_10645 [Porphyromonas gulae]|nr:hypothetical protein HQ49_10645 [Porphyromonas gulae]
MKDYKLIIRKHFDSPGISILVIFATDEELEDNSKYTFQYLISQTQIDQHKQLNDNQTCTAPIRASHPYAMRAATIDILFRPSYPHHIRKERIVNHV